MEKSGGKAILWIMLCIPLFTHGIIPLSTEGKYNILQFQ